MPDVPARRSPDGEGNTGRSRDRELPPGEEPPGLEVDVFGVEIIDEAECLELLGAATLGRVAFLDGDQPIILPVNLTLWDRHLVFCTAPGAKLAAAVMSQRVAIEIDQFDDRTHTGWSVLVKGRLSTVTDGREIASLDRLGTLPWSRPELRHTWVQVRSEQISGRRLVETA